MTTALNNNSRENQLIADSINNHNLSIGLVANQLHILCGNITTLNQTIKEQSTNQTDILTKIGEISSPDRGFRQQLLSGLSHQQRGRSPTRRTQHSQRSHARTPQLTLYLFNIYVKSPHPTTRDLYMYISSDSSSEVIISIHEDVLMLDRG